MRYHHTYGRAELPGKELGDGLAAGGGTGGVPGKAPGGYRWWGLSTRWGQLTYYQTTKGEN